MLNNGYTNFYESVRDFLIKSNLVASDSIVGASVADIAKTENLIEQTFPLAFKIFLRYFGKSQLPIYPEFAMTLPYIERAYRIDSISKIKNFLRERNYIIGSDGVKIANG